MTKPTLLQSLLNRPSQSYSFPADRDLYSGKRDMVRIASEAQVAPNHPINLNQRSISPNSFSKRGELGEGGGVNVGIVPEERVQLESHIEISAHTTTLHSRPPDNNNTLHTNTRHQDNNVHHQNGLVKDSDDSEDADNNSDVAHDGGEETATASINTTTDTEGSEGETVFYTPNTSPRTSLAGASSSLSAVVPFPPPMPKHVQALPRRPSGAMTAVVIAGSMPHPTTFPKPTPSSSLTPPLPPPPISASVRPPHSHQTHQPSQAKQAVLSTRTPVTNPPPKKRPVSSAESATSISTTIATASLDGHSLFSYTTTDSTRMTTPVPSDIGHGVRLADLPTGGGEPGGYGSFNSTITDKKAVGPAAAPSSSSHPNSLSSSSSRGQTQPLPRQKRSYAYTDEDWAKDVRWLTPPSAASGSSPSDGDIKPTSTTLSTRRSASLSSPLKSSSHFGRTNAQRQRQQQQMPTATTTTTTMTAARTKSQKVPVQGYKVSSKSKKVGGKAYVKGNSVIMSMTAVLEEDEDNFYQPGGGRLSPKSSVLVSGPARLRVASAGASPNGVPRRRNSRSGSLRSGEHPSNSSLSRSGSGSTRRSSQNNLRHRRSRSLGSADAPRQTSPSQTQAQSQQQQQDSVLFDASPYVLGSGVAEGSFSQALPSLGTPGYTSLVLPRAPPPFSNGHLPKTTDDGHVDLTLSGVAQTTMASVEVVRGLSGNVKKGLFRGIMGLGRSRSVSSSASGANLARAKSDGAASVVSALQSGGGSREKVLGFASHRKPPEFVPSGGVLVQVWGVGVDGVDGKLVGVRSSARKLSGVQRRVKQGLGRSVSLRLRRSGLQEDNATSSNNANVNEAEVGYIPGRSFVGRVMACGWDVKEEVVRKGEWVIGLLDVKKCGALAEFIVIDRRRVQRIPYPFSDKPTPSRRNTSRSTTFQHQAAASSNLDALTKNGVRKRTLPPPNMNPGLSIEELALLPTCGIPAYRAVRTFVYSFSSLQERAVKPNPAHAGFDFTSTPMNHKPAVGRTGVTTEHEPGRRRRALVLRGHDGVGGMAVQMLAKRGWRVSVHVPYPKHLPPGGDEVERYMGDVEGRISVWGAEEVIFDDGGGRQPPLAERGDGNLKQRSRDDDDEDDDDDGRGAAVRAIEGLYSDADYFDAVLDTIGGKEIWAASEKLLRCLPSPLSSSADSSKSGHAGNNNSSSKGKQKHAVGQFTTVVGDVPNRIVPTAGDHFRAGLRSLRLGGNGSPIKASTPPITADSPQPPMHQGRGKVSYAWVSVAQDVDWEGDDIRESLGAVLKLAVEDGIRPWVGPREERVVPFERAPDLFVDGGLLIGGGTAMVRIVE